MFGGDKKDDRKTTSGPSWFDEMVAMATSELSTVSSELSGLFGQTSSSSTLPLSASHLSTSSSSSTSNLSTSSSSSISTSSERLGYTTQHDAFWIPPRLTLKLYLNKEEGFLPEPENVLIAIRIHFSVEPNTSADISEQLNDCLESLYNNHNVLLDHFHHEFLAYLYVDYQTQPHQYQKNSVAKIDLTLSVTYRDSKCIACLTSRDSIGEEKIWREVSLPTSEITSSDTSGSGITGASITRTLSSKMLFTLDRYIEEKNGFFDDATKRNAAIFLKNTIIHHTLIDFVRFNDNPMMYCPGALAPNEPFKDKLPSSLNAAYAGRILNRVVLTPLLTSEGERIGSSSSSHISRSGSHSTTAPRLSIQLEYVPLTDENREAPPIFEITLPSESGQLQQRCTITKTRGLLNNELSDIYLIFEPLLNYILHRTHLTGLYEQKRRKILAEQPTKSKAFTQTKDSIEQRMKENLSALNQIVLSFDALICTTLTGNVTEHTFESISQQHLSAKSEHTRIESDIYTYNRLTRSQSLHITTEPEFYQTRFQAISEHIEASRTLVTRLQADQYASSKYFLTLFYTTLRHGDASSDTTPSLSTWTAALLNSIPNAPTNVTEIALQVSQFQLGESESALQPSSSSSSASTSSSVSTPMSPLPKDEMATLHQGLHHIATLIHGFSNPNAEFMVTAFHNEDSAWISNLATLARIPEKIEMISRFIAQASRHGRLILDDQDLNIHVPTEHIQAHLAQLSQQARALHALYTDITKLKPLITNAEAIKAYPIIVINRYDYQFCQTICEQLRQFADESQLPPILYQNVYEKLGGGDSAETASQNHFAAINNMLTQHYALQIRPSGTQPKVYEASTRQLTYLEVLASNAILRDTTATLLRASTQHTGTHPGFYGAFADFLGGVLPATASTTSGSVSTMLDADNPATSATTSDHSSSIADNEKLYHRPRHYEMLSKKLHPFVQDRITFHNLAQLKSQNFDDLVAYVNQHIEHMLLLNINETSKPFINLNYFLNELKRCYLEVEILLLRINEAMRSLLGTDASYTLKEMLSENSKLSVIIVNAIIDHRDNENFVIPCMIGKIIDEIKDKEKENEQFKYETRYVLNEKIIKLNDLLVLLSEKNILYFNAPTEKIKIDGDMHIHIVESLLTLFPGFEFKEIRSSLERINYLVYIEEKELYQEFYTLNFEFHMMHLSQHAGVAYEQTRFKKAFENFSTRLVEIYGLYQQFIHTELNTPSLSTYQPISGQIRLMLIAIAHQMISTPSRGFVTGGFYLMLWALHCTDDLSKVGICPDESMADMTLPPVPEAKGGIFGSSKPSLAQLEQAVTRHLNTNQYGLHLSHALFERFKQEYNRLIPSKAITHRAPVPLRSVSLASLPSHFSSSSPSRRVLPGSESTPALPRTSRSQSLVTTVQLPVPSDNPSSSSASSSPSRLSSSRLPGRN